MSQSLSCIQQAAKRTAGHFKLRFETNNYEINLELLGRELCTQSKLIFLSSPSNPIGHTISKDTVFKACEMSKDFGLLVLDLAYIEFADEDFTKEVLSAYSNVVVLRTLSKAFGLAGSRCGVLLASSEITNYVMRVLPPYSFSKPAEQSILEALTEEGIETSKLNSQEYNRFVETCNTMFKKSYESADVMHYIYAIYYFLSTIPLDL